ncbi:MAG: 5-oxoprolinase subunit PxpB [Oscillospiraceae bacterium]|jgi:KipI family sensor histidine kinase inhibitor|nr:5-oxoprolinase subunit PxpB [Oscillospiraceae bacterium]
MKEAFRFLPAGERAVVVECGDAIDPAVNDKVVALAASLTAKPIPGVLESVVSYRSLLVMFDPMRVGGWGLRRRLARRLRSLGAVGPAETLSRTVDIPVCYGGAFGPDLPDVAAHTGLSIEEVAHRHSAVAYRVYMIGFMPGFPYLGGLDDALVTPRLPTPRALIPAGSVGIGGNQTGVYPLDSPGGWRLIGRSPLRLYDAGSDNPVLLSAGDGVRFVPVTAEEYARIERGEWRGPYAKGVSV